MKTAAVVCEYNPLHEGHIAMLQNVRERVGEDGRILCLMSGDFVQRGEPAVFDKRKRAESAVKAGADLVLELPFPWSASVAERFCAGAVSILSRLHADGIFFGSEKKTAAELKEIAQRIASKEFEERLALLRQNEKTLSYPALVCKCYEDCYNTPLDLLPNEILGAGYISEILKRRPEMTFEALPILEGYSASEKRKELYEKDEKGRAEDGIKGIARLENGERAILCHLLLSGKEDRFSTAAAECASLDELFSLVRCKNDTDARLRRELLSVLLESAGKERKNRRSAYCSRQTKEEDRFLQKNGKIASSASSPSRRTRRRERRQRNSTPCT